MAVCWWQHFCLYNFLMFCQLFGQGEIMNVF